jgi:hypothetical protein
MRRRDAVDDAGEADAVERPTPAGAVVDEAERERPFDLGARPRLIVTVGDADSTEHAEVLRDLLLEVQPDNKSAKEIWRGLGLEMHFSTPSLIDGYLYGFSGRDEPDALFRCVEYKTGKVMWERDERGPKHAREWKTFGRASTLRADGKLYALGEWGMLGIFKPNPEKCEEIARWQIPSLHYPCWAAPVLSNGKLYLRSEDHLLCIDLSKPRK